MPTEPHTPTLAEIVRAAVDVADPYGADDRVTELMTRFEDRDEPVTAVLNNIEEEMAEAHGVIDPERDSEALANAVAVATYLAFRRDQLHDDPDELIRRATKAEDEV
jgi:hypothetical protein